MLGLFEHPKYRCALLAHASSDQERPEWHAPKLARAGVTLVCLIDGEWCHVLDEFYDDYLSFMSKNSMGTERDFSKAKCRILCANISVVGHATVENRLSVKGELGLTTDELKSIRAKLNAESLESRKMHAKRRAVEKELNFGKALKRRKADPTGVVASLLARVESNVQTKIHKAEEKARKAAVAADKKEKQDKRRIAWHKVWVDQLPSTSKWWLCNGAGTSCSCYCTSTRGGSSRCRGLGK